MPLTEMQKQMVGVERVYDEEALTCEELQKMWRCGWRTAKAKIGEKLKSGEWESVWRRIPGCKDVIAYRIRRN